jgi:predicted nucleotidyltransferase
MLHSEIQNNLPIVIQLFKKHKVKNAFAFGSVVTDQFNKNSDVDILVNLNDGIEPTEAGGHLWDLQEELQDLLKREIDLFTGQSLKNPFFIEEINDTKIKIYG